MWAKAKATYGPGRYHLWLKGLPLCLSVKGQPAKGRQEKPVAACGRCVQRLSNGGSVAA